MSLVKKSVTASLGPMFPMLLQPVIRQKIQARNFLQENKLCMNTTKRVLRALITLSLDIKSSKMGSTFTFVFLFIVDVKINENLIWYMTKLFPRHELINLISIQTICFLMLNKFIWCFIFLRKVNIEENTGN